MDPAQARTVLGLYTSTEAAPNTTPAAPAASADRTMVPALPGSRTSCSTATQPVDGTASSATSTYAATPTMPCGVTVDVSLAITASVAGITSTARCRAGGGRGGRAPRHPRCGRGYHVAVGRRRANGVCVDVVAEERRSDRGRVGVERLAAPLPALPKEPPILVAERALAQPGRGG